MKKMYNVCVTICNIIAKRSDYDHSVPVDPLQTDTINGNLVGWPTESALK